MTSPAPIPFLPCVDAASPDEVPHEQILSAPAFAYDGTPLTLAAFLAHVAVYDFGLIAPSQIILHNTANPAASWAPSADVPNWDANEGGKTEAQIKAKRQKQLLSIKNFYIGKGWTAGPHLFVDDRWIWLFTPMDTIGVHANSGNSYRVGGKLRYSIGIEVVGRYATTRWPPVIIRQLRGVVQALAQRLDIRIIYTPAPVGQPAAHDGQIALHRDYTTEKDCPGAAISGPWAADVLSASPPPSPTDPFAAWGPIDTPTGVSQGFGIPQAWLKNKATLGRCLRGERYDVPGKISRAMFIGGELRFFAQTGVVELLAYPQPLEGV